MNFSPVVTSYRTLIDLASSVQEKLTAISTGWQVQHGLQGAHTAITADSVTTDALTVNDDTQTTVGAAGGASALPATPTGYLDLTIDGTTYVVPFYAKS